MCPPQRLLCSGKSIFAPRQISFDNKIAIGGLNFVMKFAVGRLSNKTLYFVALLNPAACLAAMDEWDDLHLKWVLIFPNFVQTPTLTSNLTVSLERQWNLDYNEILTIQKYLNFSGMNLFHFCAKNTLFCPFKPMGRIFHKIPETSPFPLVTRTPV